MERVVTYQLISNCLQSECFLEGYMYTRRPINLITLRELLIPGPELPI